MVYSLGRIETILSLSAMANPHVGLRPFLFSLIVYILVGPVFLIACLVNELVRLIISVYFFFKYDGELFLVPDGCDAIWTTGLPGKPRIVLIGARIRGETRPEDIAKIYNETTLQDVDSSGFPITMKMQYILTKKFGYACWKRPDKTKYIPCPVRVVEGGHTKVFNKDDITKLLQELKEDMPDTKPQWELVIVPRYKEEGEEEESSWIWYRFHHAYNDGISAVMGFQRYFTQNFNWFVDPYMFQVPSWKRTLYYLNAAIFAPYTMLNFFKDNPSQAWKELKECQGGRNYTWSKALTLDKIRPIRRVADGTPFAAVAHNAFITACQKVLGDKEVPEEWKIQEMAALLPYPDFRPRNRFSGFPYTIKISDIDDFTRLRNSKKAYWEGVMGPWIPVAYLLVKVIGRMPLFAHSRVYRSKTTMLSSSVPSSKTQVTSVITNEPVLDLMGFPPLVNGTGVFFSSSTYGDQMKLGISADEGCLTKAQMEEIIELTPQIIEDWARKAETIENENAKQKH